MTIVRLRRDLRLEDNPALQAAIEKARPFSRSSSGRPAKRRRGSLARPQSGGCITPWLGSAIRSVTSGRA